MKGERHMLAAMDNVITVDAISKSYGQAVAVEDVSFAVRRGEIFGMLGPNGAGKTTTVECIQGLRRPDRGSIDVLGIDPAADPDLLRRRIGSQLQSSSLPDRLHVWEAVHLFSRLHGDPADVDRVLDTWDLSKLRRKPFAALSGGQQQRLFLALALLGQPEIVVLDELTSSLDPNARRDTWDLVKAVRDRGATVILVTHFMEEAEALCDRVAIVDQGRVVAIDTPIALTTGLGTEVRITFTSDGHDPHFLTQVPGVRSVGVEAEMVTVVGGPEAGIRVAGALSERGFIPIDYRIHHPSLDDVFVSLTGRALTGKDAA